MKGITRNSLKLTLAAAVTALTAVALAPPASATHEPLHTGVTTVSPGRPDLVAKWVYVIEGTKSWVEYEVRNIGAAYAGSSMLSVRKCGTTATFNDLIFVPGIAPGGSATIYLKGRVAVITADATGLVAESDEYNNRERVPFWC